jgi:hypothetical protein
MATSDRRIATRGGPRRTFRRWGDGVPATVLRSYALLWIGTLLAAAVALPFADSVRQALGHRLAPAQPGTVSMAVFIAANNMREATIPVLFAVLALGRRRLSVTIGDAVVGASFAANIALGGLALGAYGFQLIHYLPQWPLEWGGLAVALSAWRRARSGRGGYSELVLLALSAATLLCLAAFIETYAVPQS